MAAHSGVCRYRIRARPADIGAHSVEQASQVGDLRLAGGRFDDRPPLGQCGNLKKLHQKLRKERLQNQNRIDPFSELLFDRWEKADFLKAKKGTSIYHNNYIAGKVKIGKNTWVGPFTILDGSGGKLKIGNFCSISSGVQIHTHHTVKWSLSGGKSQRETGNVTIGDNCYLGPFVVVNMGTKIGKCSVIGAYAFVNSDIPPNSIVYGIPAKVVGKIKVNKGKITYSYYEK